MTIEVVMPAMEMDQDTARLVRWLKSEGEFVEKGQPLMEIETDKVTVEIEAPGSGVLSDVRVYPGTDVPVGQVVALLRDELAEPRPPSERVSAPPPLGASPVARRIAAEHGIDLSSVVGSGPEGAGFTADLEALVPSPEGARSVSADPEYEARPLAGIRRIAAERLSASYREAPHFDIGLTVDVTSLLINPPEVGILAVGRARELPAFVAGQVVSRRMLDLTLSADHRALDGATAASFLKRLEALMLEPEAHLRDEAPGSSGETRR